MAVHRSSRLFQRPVNEQVENTFGSDRPIDGPVQLLPYIFKRSAITTNFDDVLKRCYEAVGCPFSETMLGTQAHDFPLLSDRHNIVVIADEAHRSQYGFRAVLDKKTGRYKYGFAKHLRDALKNATFVGFTGTPIEGADHDTRAVFGDYVSIYDIQDAVDDGATVPIFYESRLAPRWPLQIPPPVATPNSPRWHGPPTYSAAADVRFPS